MRILGFMVAALLSAVVALPAGAQTPGVSFTGGILNTTSETRGFSFTLSEGGIITALGMYDVDADGLTDPHQVGLWTSTGDMLFSGTVLPGTDATLIDGFRYTTDLSGPGSTRLEPGSYVVGALGTPSDRSIRSVTNPSYAPGVTFGENRRNNIVGTLSFPDATQGNRDVGYFGANFLIAPVPEPATWGLMIVGFAAVGAAGRRRQRMGQVVANVR